MQERFELSIIMPCLNEIKTLPLCIDKAQRVLREHKISGEVVVADNGSTDGSIAVAKEMGARVLEIKEKGYGAALAAGINAAAGQYVLIGDADDSYDFREAHRFLAELKKGYDLVMGCRFPQGGGTIKPRAMPFLHRWLGNPILSFIGRLFFKAPFTDFYCGLRAFRKEALADMNLRATGMEFAYEMLIKSKFRNLRMTEIPITLHPDGRGRASHLKTWRDGWKTLRFMLLYSPNWLFLLPGLFLFFIGLVAVLALLPGRIEIGHVSFDGNSLVVFSMVMLIGFQIVIFAVSAKVFGVSEGLLPASLWLTRLSRFFNLERGLLVGIILTIVGVGLLIYSMDYWGKREFGNLSYPTILRLVVPSMTTLTLGIQIVFSSFFLSILNVKRRG